MKASYFQNNTDPVLKNQDGSLFIGLAILTLIVALGGAITSQLSTGGSTTLVNRNSSDRAYYLAESGYRYTAAKVKSGTSLSSLHDYEYTFIDNASSFNIKFRTYKFNIVDGGGTTTLKTKVFFGISPVFGSKDPGAGRNFYIINESDVVESFDTIIVENESGIVDEDGEYVKFVRNSGSWNTITGNVKLVAIGNGNPISEGGSLILNSSSSAFAFPPVNGRFKSSNRIYRYKRRDEDRLTGVVVDDGQAWESPPDTTLVLQSFVELHSTGTFGSGSMGASRAIVYYIPFNEGSIPEFHDRFNDLGVNDLGAWDASTYGTHEIQVIDGDNALKVTGSQEDTSKIWFLTVKNAEYSLIKFNWSNAGVYFDQLYQTAGNYLSYDAQVKVGFDSGLPGNFMPGINFRMSDSGNYGISFVNASGTSYIPSGLVPSGLGDDYGIVLWQKTGTTYKWLAYKQFPFDTDFFDDVEDAATTNSNWNTDSYVHNRWQRASEWGGNDCWRDHTIFAYSSNELSSIILENPIDLSTATIGELSFKEKYEFEIWLDKGTVHVSENMGPWTQVGQSSGFIPVEDWRTRTLDISSCMPCINCRIKFEFMSDGDDNSWTGWYVDDITVRTNKGFPVFPATILVRIIEAASVSFTSGGTTPIIAGDLLTQLNGAIGTVVSDPILSSGSWSSGNAAGVILLNNLQGNTFTNGSLLVAGEDRATAVPDFRLKDNYIRVYYSSKEDVGTPNNNPLDDIRKGISRCNSDDCNVIWPPENPGDTTSESDYYTLVQWNDDFDSSVTRLGTESQMNGVIRTDAHTTPASGTFSNTELGLHTYGGYSTNVYFDDFAIKMGDAQPPEFLPTIQE